MSKSKAQIWIKSTLAVFNTHAARTYDLTYAECPKTYLATVTIYIEDHYENKKD